MSATTKHDDCIFDPGVIPAAPSLPKAPPQHSSSPALDVGEQNRQLLVSLAALEKSQADLAKTNRELEETNRGIVSLYAELDDRTQEIQRVVDLKSRFLSNITHEFRTPLNSITSLSRMLLERADGDLTPEQEKQARFINRAARDLSELVNDLLDLAKTECCRIEINPSAVSVDELFATLRGMLRPLIEHSSMVTLSFDAPRPAVEFVCDERKLSQILRNLVSNALKYTPVGEVHVSARIVNSHIIFCVQDTGIGIPAEHQEKIFEEFYQIKNPYQQKTLGSGLGLALCRRLADLLGGGITLQSTEGVGSTFWVNLPLSTPVDKTGPSPAQARGENPFSRNVMFVDERTETLLGYERLLKHTSYQAIQARTASEALEILKRLSVSAIVTPSVPVAQTIADALPGFPSRVPQFIVACDQRAGVAEPSEVIHAFIPAAPRADQLLACLHKLSRNPRLAALVVDDATAARRLLRTILEEFDVAVLEAGTAAEAVAVIHEHEPALVFTETVLPDQTGINLFQTLLHAHKGKSLIVHSSQVFTADERDYLRRHSTELIRKGPLNDSVYRTAIIREIAKAGRTASA